MRRLQYIYAIVDASMVQILGVDPTHVRFNKDKSKFIFKTYRENSKIVNTPLYAKKQIVKILKNEEWNLNL
jgi:hypothetical protein